jgi:hypothetical protein
MRIVFAAVLARSGRMNFQLEKYEFGEALFRFCRARTAAVLTTGLVAVAA